ncbi:MAG: type II secretion system protein [Spartobacteria bacterium]|nr:type II secretion system protein [Spartobacteria bacterium]
MKPPPRLSRPNGFSLVEMAVLMVVIGLTLAIILPRVVSSSKKDFLIEQKRAVRQARNEVIGYYRRTKSLPTDNADFQKRMGHRVDRMRLPLKYNSNSSGKLTVNGTNGNNETVAFWVASLGQDRNASSSNGNNYTTDNEITLGFLTPDQNGFDDVVDYATVAFLNNGPNDTVPVIPDTDDYYDGDGLYQSGGNGNSPVILKEVDDRPNEDIKFTRPGTKVTKKDTYIQAKSVSFEVDLQIESEKDLNIEVSESVIFKKNIIFGKVGDKITITSSSGGPVSVYMLKSVYAALAVTGGFTDPQEITSDGQIFVKIILTSGPLTIQRKP